MSPKTRAKKPKPTAEHSSTDANRLDTLTRQYNEVMQSQQFISTQYDELLKDMKRVTEQNLVLRRELTAVIKKCDTLTKEANEIKAKLNFNEQEKLNMNVLIRGISTNEDAHEATKKIAHIADVDMNDVDIQAAKQIKYADKEPVIMVKFNNAEKKRQFVKAAKAKRISTQTYGYSGEPRPIYVDEQLTSESFQLFKSTKKLKKIGVRFVWIADGKILVREHENSTIYNIKTLSQLLELEKEIILRNNENGNNNGSKSLSGVSSGLAHRSMRERNENINDNGGDINSGRFVRVSKKHEPARAIHYTDTKRTHTTGHAESEKATTHNNSHSDASVLLVMNSDLDTSELEFVDC